MKKQKILQDNPWLKEKAFYHRGKHNVSVVENTLLAFEGAVNDNQPFEFDVRLSKDEQVIVFHDDDLNAMFGINKKINQLTYEELNKVSNDFHFPKLKEVLDLVNEKVGIMIEIKSNKVGVLEQKVIDILKNYNGKYVFVSFNPMSLRYLKIHSPNILRGQIASNFTSSKMNNLKKYLLKHMIFNFLSKPDFISYDINDFDVRILMSIKKRGYFIFGWTYRNKEKKAQFKKIFDNVIFENIEIKNF